MRKIFITGGFGFIGLNLISKIKKSYPQALIVILNPESKVEDLTRYNIHFINKSIAEFSSDDVDLSDADAIVLLGGLSGNNWQDIKEIEDININSNKKLLDTAVSQGSKARIIFPSSQLVYENSSSTDETIETNPDNPYALSKLKFEKVLQKTIKENTGLSFTSFRISNPYGPHIIRTQNYNYANQMLIDLLSDREINLFYGGEIIKNYIPVENVCTIFVNTIEQGLFKNEIVNLGHFENIKMIDFYTKAIKKFGKGRIEKVLQPLMKKDNIFLTDRLYSQISKEGLLNHDKALEDFQKFYKKNRKPGIRDFLI